MFGKPLKMDDGTEFYRCRFLEDKRDGSKYYLYDLFTGKKLLFKEVEGKRVAVLDITKDLKDNLVSIGGLMS